MQDTAEKTRQMLLGHAARFPQAELQDYFKYLYQSAFGCEHLAGDRQAAEERIRREAAESLPETDEPVELLDGPYCRVSLGVLRDGLTPGTLAGLFCASAAHHPEGRETLEEKLRVLLDVINAGEILPGIAHAADAVEKWRGEGFPALHHSERFRSLYAPAYRVIRADYAGYLPVFAAIDRQMAGAGRVTVAIDGNCASGKSTLADLLQRVYGCGVFHMDDFFLRPEQRTEERYAEPGGNVDRERFFEEVLRPVCAGEDVSYRPFDCGTMRLQPPVSVPAGRLTVVEGAYCLHPDLRNAYTLRVFLRIDPELQMRRILARNGSRAAGMFRDRWIPLEQAYFDAFRPELVCDVCVDVSEKP